jgi:alpha-ketoglutarate-dependent taurine dioxygenase
LVAISPFNGLTDEESQNLKDYLHGLLVGSHDIQVRFNWGENDVAIWDNRSVYSSATKDYLGNFDRTGVRTVGIG